MSNPLRTPVITTAGYDAVHEAFQNNVTHKIRYVAIGDGTAIEAYDSNGSATVEAKAATALQNERLRVEIDPNTSAKNEDQLTLLASFASNANGFVISEIGVFLEDGTLFAYTASSTANLGSIGDVVDWNFSAAFRLVSVPYQAIELYLDGQASDSVQNRLAELLANNVVSVPRPVTVAPADDDIGVAISGLQLIASAFSSPNGFAHELSEFIIYDLDGNIVHTSGETTAAISYEVPDGELLANTGYAWRVRYAGKLGTVTEWSNLSEAASFTTGTATAVQEMELYSKTFTSSTSWTAPAGATLINTLTARGGTGSEATQKEISILSVRVKKDTKFTGLHGEDPYDEASDAWSVANGLSSSNFTQKSLRKVTFYPDGSGGTNKSVNNVNGQFRKSGNIAKDGDLWTSNYNVGETTPEELTAEIVGLEQYVAEKLGGTTTAFGQTFNGGTTGQAPESSHSDIDIIEGTTYEIQVASGGQVTIEYEAYAGQ